MALLTMTATQQHPAMHVLPGASQIRVRPPAKHALQGRRTLILWHRRRVSFVHQAASPKILRQAARSALLVSMQTAQAVRRVRSVVQANIWTRRATTRSRTALAVRLAGGTMSSVVIHLCRASRAMLVVMELVAVKQVSAVEIVQLENTRLQRLPLGRRHLIA